MYFFFILFLTFHCLFSVVAMLFTDLLQGILLDFFGVPVKAQEMLDRVHELQLLAKRIKHYKDPDAQFRLVTHIRGATWSKGCGWNQGGGGGVVYCFLCHFYLLLNGLVMILGVLFS